MANTLPDPTVETVTGTDFLTNVTVQVRATAADGTVTTGAGIVLGSDRQEILTASDIVWSQAAGAAVQVSVQPLLNGTSSTGSFAVDHYHYFQTGALNDLSAQADFALLHVAQPLTNRNPSGFTSIDVNYHDLNVFGAQLGLHQHGSDAAIIGYPASQGGNTLVSVFWPGVTHDPFTSSLDYTGPHLDPSFRGAPILTGSSAPFIEQVPGVATSTGTLAVVSWPVEKVIQSWLAADQSGSTPSGAIASAPPSLMHTITSDTGAVGINPAEAVLVDAFSYKVNNADVAAAGMDPAVHFALYGWHENRAPDPLFDVQFYLQHNPDVAASGMDPLLHYANYGWKEGRDPSAHFSTSQYLADNPDVQKVAMDPLQHYLYYGVTEFRTTTAVS